MENETLAIRNIRTEDHETIYAIANRAYQNAKKSNRAALGDRLADLAYPGGDDRSKGEEIRRFLEKNPGQAIVAEHAGRIVGFATWRIEGVFGVIGNNAADPLNHVPGTGTILYKELLKIFKAHGCQAAKVMTGLADAFAPARKAYQKAGFKRCIQSVTYYQDLNEEA